MYCCSKIDLSIIKKCVVNNYKKINSLLVKVVTTMNEMRKNKMKIKKTDNRYLIVLQKLNDKMMMKLAVTIKKATEADNKNSDND